jgi:hypothetical protein
MPGHPISCPDCGEPVEYWRVHCRCGQFLGYPNHRAAESERADLTARCDSAREDAKGRGVASLLAKLETLVEQSRPVISMSFAACDDLMRAGKYRNYHQRVASAERSPAREQDHADRDIVGGRLFPMYKEHIQYAVLSPDGKGLSSYGPVAVRWEVTAPYLGRRMSLLEENSFTFYDEHALGRRGASVPLGRQSVWEDRTMLAAAKHTANLTAATPESDLRNILLNPGATRKDDEFIEIFVYAEDGLDTRDVDMVTLQLAATTRDESGRWKLIKEACASRTPRTSVVE